MGLRVAIAHYHLHPGGVTRIIEHAVTALAARGVQVVVLAGEPPENAWTTSVQVVDRLAYDERRSSCSPSVLADDMVAAARSALGATPDLWHVHNHCLGKNLALPEALCRLARAGHRMLLQIHDFPEDGRPANYRRLLEHVGGNDSARLTRYLYPQGAHIHYAVLNGRDRAILQAAGVPSARLHALPNPIHLEIETETGMAVGPHEGRLWLYPTRAIRRKNLGEFLLWAATAKPGDRFATTLAPKNPIERPRYEEWRTLARSLRLPVDFEVGTDPGVRFPDLLASAHALVTTSIAEGFGMAFLEPWLAGRPIVGRNLAEITREFVAAGVSLPHLYDRLDVPVDWVGGEALASGAKEALERTMHAYGRVPLDADVERTLHAWCKDGMVDFGRLDESRQAQILRRVVDSRSARTQLAPPRLPEPKEDPTLLLQNRQAIEAGFGLEHYGPALLAIYGKVMVAQPTPLDALAAGAILDQFLAPERLFMLRS